MKKEKMISLAGCVILILCTFLPYATAELLGMKESVTLIEGGDGIFFIILAALALVFTFLDKKIIVLIASALTVLITIVEISAFSKQIDANIYGSMIHRSVGFFLMIIGTIVLVVGAILDKKNN